VQSAVALAQSTDSWPGEAPLIPRGVPFGDPGTFAVRISPDGKRFAFLARAERVSKMWS
jgi:hypothetical protein